MRLVVLFLTFFLLQVHTAFATTPFVSGGTITSPYGPRDYNGHRFHYGIDLGVDQGVAIRAPEDNCVVSHGLGNGYVSWVEIQMPDGSSWLIGDCDPELTMACKTGIVHEGDVIGVVGGAYDGPLGFSSGAHMHIEYRAYPGAALEDPVYALQQLGMNLDGSTSSQDYIDHHMDDLELPWGLESMYELGDDIGKQMKFFAEQTGNGFKALDRAAIELLLIIAIIDLALPVLLAGFQILSFSFLKKVFKYCFLFFLLYHWATLMNDFFLNMIQSFAGTFTGHAAAVAERISQPQLILKSGIHMMMPGLNIISRSKTISFILNFKFILPVMLISWVTILIYFLLAVKVALMYIEFYFTAVFNVVTLPFAASSFSKFLPEGTLGHLFTCMFQLMLTSVMVYFLIGVLQQANPAGVFEAVEEDNFIVQSFEMVARQFSLCFQMWGMAYLIGVVPTKIARVLGGAYELP